MPGHNRLRPELPRKEERLLTIRRLRARQAPKSRSRCRQQRQPSSVGVGLFSLSSLTWPLGRSFDKSRISHAVSRNLSLTASCFSQPHGNRRSRSIRASTQTGKVPLAIGQPISLKRTVSRAPSAFSARMTRTSFKAPGGSTLRIGCSGDVVAESAHIGGQVNSSRPGRTGRKEEPWRFAWCPTTGVRRPSARWC